MITRYDAESRYERFAQLRAASPEVEFEQIMDKIRDEEDEAAETAHYNSIPAIDA